MPDKISLNQQVRAMQTITRMIHYGDSSARQAERELLVRQCEAIAATLEFIAQHEQAFRSYIKARKSSQ